LPGPSGKWTQVGAANLANIDEAALARTPDGTLHAVWTIPSSNNDSLVHAAIGANGITDKNGHATIALRPSTGKSIRATATKPGYSTASTKIRVQ
jgi:hypothetical protein